MDTGRIQAVVLANNRSNVIYERFYAKFSDLERASIREAFQQASGGRLIGSTDEYERCARYRGGVIAVRAENDLVLYGLGTGEYDELNLAEVLSAVAAALRSLLRRPPTEALLLDNYGQLCIAMDEVIQEGILEAADPDDLKQHMKMQVEA